MGAAMTIVSAASASSMRESAKATAACSSRVRASGALTRAAKVSLDRCGILAGASARSTTRPRGLFRVQPAMNSPAISRDLDWPLNRLELTKSRLAFDAMVMGPLLNVGSRLCASGETMRLLIHHENRPTCDYILHIL